MPVQNHHDRCNELREFILLQGRFPAYTPDDKEENSLCAWMLDHRKLAYASTTKKQQQLENFASIHPGLTAKKLDYNYCCTPQLWKDQYERFNNDANLRAVETYTSPYMNRRFVPLDMSFQQYLIERFQIKNRFSPLDCNPTQAVSGSMQHVISYALYPEHYGMSQWPTQQHTTINFPNTPYAPYPSSLFKRQHYTTSLNNKLQTVEDMLFPDNLLQRIRECPDATTVKELLLQNVGLFDAFNFGKNGQGSSEVVCIMDTIFNQPRRTAYSCFIDPAHYSPKLDTNVQDLYTYGVAGRPKIDERCRQIPTWLYEFGVETWKHCYSTLSPPSQICPPTICHVLVYIDSYHPGKRWKCNMALHKDNPCTRKPPSSQSSHIAGTDVIMTSIGDTINYELVKHNNLAATYDDYEANRGLGSEWVHTIPLEGGSTYVHSASDDVRYAHTLEFPKLGSNPHRGENKPNTTRVRAGLIWRWAGKLQSFRANEDEDRRHKFSAVGREPFLHAYNKEPPMDTVTWKSMGYLDDNGHNTIMPLLKL